MQTNIYICKLKCILEWLFLNINNMLMQLKCYIRRYKIP